MTDLDIAVIALDFVGVHVLVVHVMGIQWFADPGAD